MELLGPLQWGSHEEQEGAVHVMNGAQVTSTFGTDPCLGLNVAVKDVHTLRGMDRPTRGKLMSHVRTHAHTEHARCRAGWTLGVNSPLISTLSTLSLLSQEQ